MYRTQREELILKYYPLVRATAKRMIRRMPESVDLEELVSLGCIGLIDAADRFVQGKHVSFGAYARIRIQGAMLDGMRRNDFIPRTVRMRARRIRYAKDQLGQRLGRKPSEQEIASFLEISSEALANFQRLAEISALVSIDETRQHSEDRLLDTIPGEHDDPTEEVEASEVRSQVGSVLQELSPRDRDIVRLYYFDNRTLREIGELLGVTESRVSQLHARIRARLTESLTFAA